MSATSQHLAYEIDAAARIATVVYIGQISDDEVLNLYAHLIDEYPDFPTYDYLLDMRYTDWRASADVIASLDGLLQRRDTDYRRRIAIVRKAADLTNRQQESALHEGLNHRAVRYFAEMDPAREWLLAQS